MLDKQCILNPGFLIAADCAIYAVAMLATSSLAGENMVDI